MTVYHLQITLLDRSSPNSSRRILRGSTSIRSAGRTPHPTVTGLPGKLDFHISDSPTYLPSQSGFWEDLSQVPTTRIGERWDRLPELKPINPKAYWYEPDSILPNSQSTTTTTTTTTFTPAPTLDYRFGPISVDWIDHPDCHPAFSNSCEESLNYKPTSESNSNLQPSQPEIKKGMKDYKKEEIYQTEKSPNPQTNLPTGRFESQDFNQKGKYQLGSTDFGYGTVHLYRDFEEASASSPSSNQLNWIDGDPSWTKKHPKRVNQNLASTSTSNQDDTQREEDTEGTVIGVLAIPSYMTAQESIQSVRMLRDALPNRCMGLIKFRSRQYADRFAHEFNGRPFSHLQDREICHTARIRSIQFKSSLIPPFTFPALLPPDFMTHSAHELPTCPVCLERMDASVTGLLTSTCSHTFHCHCLSNWGDSRCPICRYSQTRLYGPSKEGEGNSNPSECAACGSEANLWICLICGHVGCGRYQGGHAYRHFEESAHLYALELGSQRVWDYVGDNYVHRLIQTKSDQIVELPALSSAVFDSRSGSGGPGPNEAAQQSKIEAISEEFGHLVASQLDSQRNFYEKEIEILKERLNETGNLNIRFKPKLESMKESKETDQRLEIEIQELKERNESLRLERDEVYKEYQNDKLKLEKKCEKFMELSKKFELELKEEKAMSLGFRIKLNKLESDCELSEKNRKGLEEEVGELRDQLRDVMFFLDAQTKIEKEGGEEMRGGTLVVNSNETNVNSGKSNRKKKK
ncbi:uncharacterized protein MELLADRAFT_84903 [Melampsora larici-populina 98AG31]|uniref:Uncharacterized protein n=1 Tax=Melampsora larici-populina (strain 98AG31 / pathotype 3-4-7) TaxID=747676 RepID=F4RH71_MELLP|nr:uncharacterized protein MELLADRAFT_84903 [Melampsora larici-populina 98AG31]EGG08381.1 hypothetical protein MELLADRAFT_84903 [Melampsora larici-populina 98AG31]